MNKLSYLYLAVVFFDISGKPLGDGKPVSHAVNRTFLLLIIYILL